MAPPTHALSEVYASSLSIHNPLSLFLTGFRFLFFSSLALTFVAIARGTLSIVQLTTLWTFVPLRQGSCYRSSEWTTT